jgi:hypothetical protein
MVLRLATVSLSLLELLYVVGMVDVVGLGEDDCGGSLTIAGTRMMSSCSNIVASITCNSDVCYHPGMRVN